jgi:ferredoxin-nitrite reductase
MMIAAQLERRITLDQPVNIHLTGCPHSCAQHMVGDIGLLAVKVGDDMVEGYTIFVGGGAGPEQRIGREIFPHVPAEQVPNRLETMLRGYLARRRAGESFNDFAARHSLDELTALFARVSEMAA